MNKYHFIFLIWLLPVYFMMQGGYQVFSYYGIQATYNEGNSYIASVIDFDVKQIAAQTNGYVVLGFTTENGENINERLALPVQFAQVIMESELIPVRYLESSFSPIVMMPVYELQQNVIRVNIAVTSFGLIVTIVISLIASRFARRRIRDGEEILSIENLDEIKSNPAR
ncbi:MAG: hypothetical protein EA359_02140 [Balneolaceae bacterium]|nr:MAG: hypothetical protein EA359_02140 [Balneolaceae bacterium]